jgi:predicted acetyltransferase
MEIILEKVDIKNKNILSNLLQLYLHDIEKDFFVGIDLDENESFSYPHLDEYWEKEEYIPYFIKLESEIIGFILINNNFQILGKENNSYNLAEMFIINKYKRKGIGKNVMFQIFKKYSGKWEVRPVPNSKGAELFWENTIKEYTQNKYEIRHVGKYKRPIFTFDTTEI